MPGSNPGLLRLWHWQSDAPTTRLDLIHNSARSHILSARSHPRSARHHPHWARSHPCSAKSHPRNVILSAKILFISYANPNLPRSYKPNSSQKICRLPNISHCSRSWIPKIWREFIPKFMYTVYIWSLPVAPSAWPAGAPGHVRAGSPCRRGRRTEYPPEDSAFIIICIGIWFLFRWARARLPVFFNNVDHLLIFLARANHNYFYCDPDSVGNNEHRKK